MVRPSNCRTQDELLVLSGHHRKLMQGEAVPRVPSLYEQLAMVSRAAGWVVREEVQIQ